MLHFLPFGQPQASVFPRNTRNTRKVHATPRQMKPPVVPPGGDAPSVGGPKGRPFVRLRLERPPPPAARPSASLCQNQFTKNSRPGEHSPRRGAERGAQGHPGRRGWKASAFQGPPDRMAGRPARPPGTGDKDNHGFFRVFRGKICNTLLEHSLILSLVQSR